MAGDAMRLAPRKHRIAGGIRDRVAAELVRCAAIEFEIARTRGDVGTRLWQAVAPGACRRRRVCALFRILWRRIGQVRRRHDPVSRRLYGAYVARAAWRHRPYHPVELSAPDFRAFSWRR